MSQWFRMYGEVLNDPKVQRLPGEDFKGWVNILCLASQNDGDIPPVEDVAFALRIDIKKARNLLEKLIAGGLVVRGETAMRPHKWDARQFKSDVSTDRVKRFRQRSKQRDETVPETPSETAPDTETEQSVPLSNDNGRSAKILDPAKVLFDAGVALITQAGKSEAQARSWLGKARKDFSDPAIIAAISSAKREGAIDPIAFMEKSLRSAAIRARQDEDEMPIC